MLKPLPVTCLPESNRRGWFFFFLFVVLFAASCNNEADKVELKRQKAVENPDIIQGILKYDTLNESGVYTQSQRLPILDSLMAVAIERNDVYNISNIQRRRGIFWIEMGKQDSALNSFLISLDKAREFGDRLMITQGYYYLSELYLHFAIPEKAFPYLKEYMKLAKDMNRVDLYVEGNIHYTKAYMQLGKWKNALNSARFVVRNIPNVIPYAKMFYADSILHHLDYVKCMEKVYPDSTLKVLPDLLQKTALEPQVKIKSEVYSYAALLMAKHNNKQAKQYEDSALKYFNTSLNFETKASVVSNIHDYYAELGQTNHAYKYAMMEKEIRSQMYSREKLLSVTGLNETYNKLTNKTILLLNEQALKRRNYLIFALLFLFLVIVLAVLIIKSVRQKRLIAEINLQNKNREVQDLMKQQELATVGIMLEGQEKERKRIAQELHDRLGGLLNISRLTLEGIADNNAANNESKIKETASMLSEAADEVRRISHDLHGGAVMRFGLAKALGELAKIIMNANELKVFVHSASMPQNLPNELEIDIYRICQELLTNSLKYSKATEIHIQVLDNGDGIVSLSYEDNGVGFEKNLIGQKGGIGFENIFHRVKKYEGNYDIETRPGDGFSFFAHFEPQLNRKL